MAQPKALATAAQEPGLTLKFSPQLAEAIVPAQNKSASVFLRADAISGRTDQDTVLTGHAELRKAGTVVLADQLSYDQATDRAVATGNVLVNRSGNVFEGTSLDLKLEAFEGFFASPRYHFLQNDAHGSADRADFKDADHAVVHNATYTTCKREPGPDWLPAWILRAKRIELDNAEETGIAQGAVLSFQGVPILPIPAISFPLTDKRKSGLLPPTFGLDTVNGIEVVTPYYWNIAPNRDATITPTFMTLRGVDMGLEFRYLEPTFMGALRTNYMAADRLRGADRWGVSLTHGGSVDTGVAAIGAVGVSVNLNRVSDDDYWRDFTRTSPSLTQRLLPNDVAASWSQGPWSSAVRVLQWQTLQDPAAPIVPPYNRAPQVSARYALNNVRSFDFSADLDFTQFESDRTLTLQPNAQRSLGIVQFSRPWLAPAGFFIPKLQVHAAHYQFDAPLADTNRATDSVVPTLSVDSGLVFERDAQLWGRKLVQTLEPRAFYVYTPYRNQALLPNYDTASNDFNFASIYTDNAFVGHDKIADNNLLTLGASTRLLDADTGAQIARFGIAQRLRFDEQKVTLLPTDSPAAAGFSDVLLGASVNVDSRWSLDSTVQYNAKTEQSVRATLGASYRPADFKVLNAAYRYQRDLSEQVDVSWQWPLTAGTKRADGVASRSGRYYSVGRMNYSLNERRLVDAVLGVEYDAGCWLGRVVYQRVQTSASSSTDNIAFQLEFVGFTQLGVGRSPRSTFSQNIARYQNLRAPAVSPSRFSNYD